MTIIATTPAVSCTHRLPTIGPYTTFGSKLCACSIVCASPSCNSGYLLAGNGRGYRYWPLNLLDLLVDEGLHFGDVLRLEMGEPSLRLHVVADGLVLLRHLRVFIHAVFPLVVRPHARLDGQLGHVGRHLFIEQPALGTGTKNVEECGPRLAQGFPDLVHQVERMRNRRGGDALYRRVTADDHFRDVRGEKGLAFGDLLAGRGERGRGAVWRRRRGLDSRVRIRLVVVADEENFVIAVHHPGHCLETDVDAAYVACHDDDVREGPAVPALARRDLEGGFDAGSHGACVRDLGVDP